MTREKEIELLKKRLVKLTGDAEQSDAIDNTLLGAPRQTAVARLRHDPIVQRFREEVERGMIEADTARQILSLLRAVLSEAVGS